MSSPFTNFGHSLTFPRFFAALGLIFNISYKYWPNKNFLLSKNSLMHPASVYPDLCVRLVWSVDASYGLIFHEATAASGGTELGSGELKGVSYILHNM